MRILGVETSGPRAGIALADGDKLVAGGELQVRGRTGEKLTSLMGGLLELAEWRLAELDRIAVDVGPGSFTGLRVGLAMAKGLSLGAGVPVVPVSSLQVLATQAPGEEPVLVSLPAPRGMVYAAAFARGPFGLEPLVEEGCWDTDELWARLEGERSLMNSPRIQLLGPLAWSGELSGPAAIRPRLVHWPQIEPSAIQVARLGLDTGRNALTGDELSALVPKYLRGADVREPKTRTPTQTAP